jgi:hypothetical protein
MAEDDFIEGIYNFCDGWCEKCPYTSKCSYFAENMKEQAPVSAFDEEKNEEFWAKLHSLFAETFDMLIKLAEDHNVDISDIEKVEISVSDDDDDYDDDDEDEDEYEEEDDDDLLGGDLEIILDELGDDSDITDEDIYDDGMDDVSRKIVYSSVLVDLCNNYALLTQDWFSYSEEIIIKREDSFNNLLEMDIPGIDAEKMFLTINDAIDVINWYLFLIDERVKKALFDKMNKTEGEENDFNGSAKAALVGIDRCIASWCSLYEQFEETEDRILTILLMLSDLKTKIEEEFPEARDFIRVGLDKQ